MTRNLSLLFFVLLSTLSSGQNNLRKGLDIPEIDDHDIVINGVLDESQWAQGAQIQFLEHFFKKGEIDEIWITFPDPRPKEKDEKRRLISPRFLTIYQNLLKKKKLNQIDLNLEQLEL